MRSKAVHVAGCKGTRSHSSHSDGERRIAMTGARPDDPTRIFSGIIRSVRLATGRAIRYHLDEMNATVAIVAGDALHQSPVHEPSAAVKIRAKLFSKSVSLVLTGTGLCCEVRWRMVRVS
jgi:hypothetical protein